MKSISRLSLSLAVVVSALGVAPARADEPAAYDIQKSKVQAAVGVPAKAPLTVQGKNGWHVNEQAPITVSSKGDAGVELPKPKLARADLVQSTKDAARFEIPFTVTSPGKKTITAEARFVMCQEQACKPMRETVALEIEVADPAASPAAAKPARKSKTTAP